MNRLLITSIIIGILAVLIPLFTLLFNRETFHEKNLDSPQHELKIDNTTEVLDANGQLSKIGWSKKYDNIYFSREHIKTSTSYMRVLDKLRYKKWEAFVFFHKDFVLGISVFDISYFGGYLVHFASLNNTGVNKNLSTKAYISIADEKVNVSTRVEHVVTENVSMVITNANVSSENINQTEVLNVVKNYLCENHTTALVEDAQTNTTALSDNIASTNINQPEVTGPNFAFEHLNPIDRPTIPDDYSYANTFKQALFGSESFNYSQSKQVQGIQWLQSVFNHNKLNFTLDLKLRGKDFDSMVSLTPISEDSTLFYYNIKTFNLLARNTFEINGVTINPKDVSVVYDSGRGVWPVKSGWVWAAAAGLTEDNEQIGLNFGHGFSNLLSSKHTEDAFFIEGRVFKLSSTSTEKLPSGEWEFVAKPTETIKNSCNVKFLPEKEKTNESSINLIFAKSRFTIYYGVYSGSCQSEEGKVYNFSVTGMLEDKRSVW